MTESSNASTDDHGHATEIDDVDAEMDVRAPGQDPAVAEYPGNARRGTALRESKTMRYSV